MAIQDPARTPRLPEVLGPFHYKFRPSPAGPFGMILIQAPQDAPRLRRGDLLTLSTSGGYDVDFEVLDVLKKGEGWQAECEPRSRLTGPWKS